MITCRKNLENVIKLLQLLAISGCGKPIYLHNIWRLQQAKGVKLNITCYGINKNFTSNESHILYDIITTISLGPFMFMPVKLTLGWMNFI